jgi:WD40 repeat protein/serine/threonine protein kinase
MNERSIFMQALDFGDIGEQEAYLGRACGDDDQLRSRVEALLRSHRSDGSFMLDRGLVADLAVTVDVPPPTERPGTVIGPYKLLEQIGEGGFGAVFMAEQTQPVRRKVALKVLKPGMDTRQVIARFEAERQALAIMDHPNIAKVLDGGATPSGRPFFVMELVKGVPITEFCDQDHLTPRQRLKLFIPVCQAVQHAHQKGIIHRDLKPSNVLVTMHDTTPVVKVIDFGVAKALGQELTDKTLFTGFAQMIGTPLYMSPEQAGQSGLDIDTRSDIYSLGVLLYELLTGTTPFDKERFKKAAYDEIRRIIREEEPPKPSTRLSDSKDSLPEISAHRHTESAKLTKLVRGELDWIVMKALEKDRNRRYEMASALAADVERYLHDEPVQACPPSALYRFRKFARRNQRVAVMASFALVLLVLAVTTLAVSYAQVQSALQRTSVALEREKEVTYLRGIALAGRELAAGNVGRAEELLGECPEQLRGWEWNFLKRRRYDDAPPMQHTSSVFHVAFSPDDAQIATAGMAGTIVIWDARTGQELQRLEPQSAAFVSNVTYSLNGRYLAGALNDGTVRVWGVDSAGRAGLLPDLGVLGGHGKGGKGCCVAFSPDSRTLASGGADRTVRLWDLTSGQRLDEFSGHPTAVISVAFRPGDRNVVAACDDGTVKVWDQSTRTETDSFLCEGLEYPFGAFFSPDARQLAYSCRDGVVKVWDTTTGEQVINRQTNTHACRAVAFHPEGKRIALAGFDGTLRVLDARGQELLTIFAHPSLVAGAVFSHDGNMLASASYDHTVRIWNATPLDGDPTSGHSVTLTGHNQLVSAVDFSPDGRWLASASRDGTVRVWEVEAEEPLGSRRLPAITLRYTLHHSGVLTSVAFSSDMRTLASAGWDKIVKLWDLQAPVGDSLTERLSILCPTQVSSLGFSPDGGLLAIGQANGIAMYDPASGEEVPHFKSTLAGVPSLAFHPFRPLMISAGASDPAVKVWDVSGETHRFEIRHDTNPNASVAVSPDGRLVASPARDQAAAEPTMKIWEVDWDANTYQELHTLRGHMRYVWKVVFSPDGRYLASGSWDSTVKIWDVKTGKELKTLRGHAGFIYGLAFSPDSRYLATASGYAGHGEVKVWDATLWRDNASGEQ